MGTFSNMTKRITVKLRGIDVQFSVQTEAFGKIPLISQSRVLDFKEIFKYSLGSVPYALADHLGMMVKTKKLDLLIELKKGTVLVSQMPKSSCSIADGMTLMRKVKCSGLTFHVAEEIFKAAMSCSYNSARVDIVFDVYFEQSIKNIERNRRCSDTISFKKKCWKSCSSTMELLMLNIII